MKLEPFNFEDISVEQQRNAWNDYKRSFMYAAKALDERLPKRLWKNKFLDAAGKQVQALYETLPGALYGLDAEDTEDDDDTDHFKDMIALFDEHFAPKQHESYERSEFWSMQPEQGEALNKFQLRVQAQARKCRFGRSETESRDIAIMDKMILLLPSDLRKKVLNKKDLDVAKMTRIINSYLSTEAQDRKMAQMGNTMNTSKDEAIAYVTKRKSDRNFKQCTQCGYRDHTSRDQNCPARTRKCYTCHEYGHFEKFCNQTKKELKRPANQEKHWRVRDPQPGSSRGNNPWKRQKVHAIDDKQSDGSQHTSDEDDLNFVNAIGETHDEIVNCEIGGIPVQLLIDSGSKYNILDESTWKYLKTGAAKMYNERTSSKVLSAYAQNTNLSIICEFEAVVQIPNRTGKIEATFLVIKGGRRALLGRDSSKILGVLRLGLQSLDVNMVKTIVTPFPKIKGRLVSGLEGIAMET